MHWQLALHTFPPPMHQSIHTKNNTLFKNNANMTFIPTISAQSFKIFMPNCLAWNLWLKRFSSLRTAEPVSDGCWFPVLLLLLPSCYDWSCCCANSGFWIKRCLWWCLFSCLWQENNHLIKSPKTNLVKMMFQIFVDFPSMCHSAISQILRNT